MRIENKEKHTILIADKYITQAEDVDNNTRVFVKSVRVPKGVISYREATDAEIAAWEEYKKRQEEENVYDV